MKKQDFSSYTNIFVYTNFFIKTFFLFRAIMECVHDHETGGYNET